jgi:indolepyruvate ferredoxin oxidoreductase
VDGPRDTRLHPDGRRGRQLDRRGAVLEAAARVPEHGRRHLQPFRLDGDPRRHRRRHQHYLQDPVQRCGRHDRRSGQRGRAHRAAGGTRSRRRRGEARRHRHRRAGQVPPRDQMAGRHLNSSPR